jgi:hypothetical protein
VGRRGLKETDRKEQEMPTKSQILSAARKKWGKNVQLRENPKAPTPAAKEAVRKEQEGLRARRKAAEEERKSLGVVHGPLLAAARFALDVGGDEPSWTQLREAVEKAERSKQLTDELADLDKQMKTNSGRLYASRYELSQDESLGGLWIRHVLARKDTLEELAAEVGLTTMNGEE